VGPSGIDGLRLMGRLYICKKKTKRLRLFVNYTTKLPGLMFDQSRRYFQVIFEGYLEVIFARGC